MMNHLHLSRPAALSHDAGRRRLWLLVGAAVLAAALVGSAARPIGAGAAKEGDHQVSGGGRTIIEGGGPGLVPVTTVLAFHANGQGGDFECLALMPPVATSFSPESGDFEVHAMYVTGKVTSVSGWWPRHDGRAHGLGVDVPRDSARGSDNRPLGFAERS